MFIDDRQLSIHVKNKHVFQSKPCPKGCEPEKNYDTESSYKMHMERVHSGRWPTACLFPGCQSTKTFPDVSKYSDHLMKAHELNTNAARQPYFPPESAQKLKKVWEPSSCPVTGCPVTTKYKAKYDLAVHINSKHNVEKKEAFEMAAYGYVFKLASEVEQKRKRATKLEEADEEDGVSADEGRVQKADGATKKKR